MSDSYPKLKELMVMGLWERDGGIRFHQVCNLESSVVFLVGPYTCTGFDVDSQASCHKEVVLSFPIAFPHGSTTSSFSSMMSCHPWETPGDTNREHLATENEGVGGKWIPLPNASRQNNFTSCCSVD